VSNHLQYISCIRW